jgi:glycosyl transferase family 2
VDLRAVSGETTSITLLVRTTGGSWHEAVAADLPTIPPPREQDGARRRAAFTISQNEPLMLPIWLDYYGRYFDADDLYVIDHDSTDGSTSDLEDRCRVVPVHRLVAFDHHWLKTTVEAFQAFLLRSYDTVLFAEVDELVVADPNRHSGLDSYIDGLALPAARCVGFNVVQQADEPPLRFDRPLLAQRRYWQASPYYSKRLLSRVPLRWADGFHEEYSAPDDPPDPALVLVHLHRIDYDACLARHRSSAAREWNEADAQQAVDGRGSRTAASIADPIEFEEWFRRGPDLDSPRELIPEQFRGVV